MNTAASYCIPNYFNTTRAICLWDSLIPHSAWEDMREYPYNQINLRHIGKDSQAHFECLQFHSQLFADMSKLTAWTRDNYFKSTLSNWDISLSSIQVFESFTLSMLWSYKYRYWPQYRLNHFESCGNHSKRPSLFGLLLFHCSLVAY